MLIETLMWVIYEILDLLLIFEIPDLPANVESYVTTLFDYLTTGGSILANYVPLGYLLSLLVIIIAVDTGIQIFKFVMWLIRKIPMLGMS